MQCTAPARYVTLRQNTRDKVTRSSRTATASLTFRPNSDVGYHCWQVVLRNAKRAAVVDAFVTGQARRHYDVWGMMMYNSHQQPLYISPK